MIRQVTTSQILSFRGKQASEVKDEEQSVAGKTAQKVKDVGKTITEQIPMADKLLNNDSSNNKVKCSLIMLTLGGILSPIVGKVLDPLIGSEGKYVQWANKLSNKTAGLDKFFAKHRPPSILPSRVGEKVQYYFKPKHVKMFKDGYYSVAGLEKPARVARSAALKAGNIEQYAKSQRTLSTLFATKKMGTLGKLFGKAGIFLQNNLTGMVGVLNGLFATMTVVNVINAKSDEKVSTFMEDILGTWIGSLGGFKLFEGAMNGLSTFVDPKTNKVLEKGVLPSIAKAVNKLPLKGLIVPIAGAAVVSSVLRSASHAVFGKPTKEAPVTIDSIESFDMWFSQITS